MSADPRFVDPGKFDFRLRSGSPMIDAGLPLTRTAAAGRGRVLQVADATFFSDGFGIVKPDVIRVGEERVKAVKVDYDQNRITLDREIAWKTDAPVTLDFKGRGPDIGAFEAGE